MHVPRFSGESDGDSAFPLREILREAEEGFITVTFGRGRWPEHGTGFLLTFVPG